MCDNGKVSPLCDNLLCFHFHEKSSSFDSLEILIYDKGHVHIIRIHCTFVILDLYLSMNKEKKNHATFQNEKPGNLRIENDHLQNVFFFHSENEKLQTESFLDICISNQN